MAYLWLIIILAFVLLMLACWIALRQIKKNKMKQQEIPQELLEKFELAEKRMKGGINNGESINPYTILWEISGGNRFGESSTPISETEQAIKGRELCGEPEGRKDIQTGTITNPSEHTEINRPIVTDNSRNFFAKLRDKLRGTKEQ